MKVIEWELICIWNGVNNLKNSVQIVEVYNSFLNDIYHA